MKIMRAISCLLLWVALAPVYAIEMASSSGVPHNAGGNKQGVKWHPGHYIQLYPDQKEPEYFDSAVRDLESNPIFRGVMKQYFWNKLEPRYGVYDFSEIRADLNKLATADKRLVVAIQGVSFLTRKKLVPSYLINQTYEGGVYRIDAGKGFNIAYYNPQVQNRLIALLHALGKEFDGHPYLEAIRLQETAPSRRDLGWRRAYVTRYMDGMLAVAVAAKAAFPRTVVLQYINFPERFLPRFVENLESAGVGIGGPDVRQHDRYLAQGAYSLYRGVSGVVPIGVSVDYGNYESSGPASTERPTIESIFNFAVDELQPNYMFWLRRTAEPSNGSNYWQEVLDYLAKSKSQDAPAGGLQASCPSKLVECVD